MMFAMLAEADVVAKMKAKQMVTFPTHLEWLVYFSSSSILLFFALPHLDYTLKLFYQIYWHSLD